MCKCSAIGCRTGMHVQMQCNSVQDKNACANTVQVQCRTAMHVYMQCNRVQDSNVCANAVQMQCWTGMHVQIQRDKLMARYIHAARKKCKNFKCAVPGLLCTATRRAYLSAPHLLPCAR